MQNTSQYDYEQKISEAIRSNSDTLSLYGRYQRGEPLPKSLLDIPSLRHLRLDHFFTDIPAWLINLTSLESLEIEEGDSAKEILPLLWKLRRLRKLTLAYVDVDELPSSFAKLKHLEELNIDGADSTHFPSVIASLASLQSFSFKYCYCPLSEVFDTLSKLPRLKKLRLTFTTDEEDGDFLPESFCRLQAIEELHFNGWNDLKELPECIGNMCNLRVIDISNDDHQLGYDAAINELPEAIGKLKNLEELDVYGLQDLKQFPPSFASLSQLKRLNTIGTGIDELQLTAEQWKNLEELHMHGPLPDLRQCANLKKFSWFKTNVGINHIRGGIPYGTNELISLPLSPLRKLESLWIMGGALDSTAFLASMANLRVLHLSCDFESFPAGFEKLNKLEEISIWGAKSLTALPEYLGSMPQLKELSLTGCGVKSLPKSVRERKDLYIDVRYCPVKWPE